ncbi:MAG: hypothetical protein NTZ81_00530 [Actinobacteria bacterium]|nr:hypothetical protein [Actinomycetota bacterium]
MENVTLLRRDARLKAWVPIVVTLLGITMLARFAALANIPWGIVVKEEFVGSVTLVTPLPLNALDPMVVTLLGSVTETRLVVPQKAHSPMLVRLLVSAKLTPVMVALASAPTSMLVTLLGMTAVPVHPVFPVIVLVWSSIVKKPLVPFEPQLTVLVLALAVPVKPSPAASMIPSRRKVRTGRVKEECICG